LGEDRLWLRGRAESEEALFQIDQRLRAIPGAERFRVVDADLLQPIDRMLPTCSCPQGPWQKADSVLDVELPSAGLGAPKPNEVTLQIVRAPSVLANASLTPSILECDFLALSQWALRSSEVRLGALAFACDATGQTIVRGLPLPPLAGRRWIEYDRVAVEVGYSWEPAVSVRTLNLAVAQSDDSIHFLEADGRERVIDHFSFVKATRGSVRATAESIGVRCE